MLPALASPILLLGRADAARPRVHRGGRNWLVAQDLIGACHMHTFVHKKIPRHMKLRAHTRDTANSPGKSAFSGSLQRKRDASFAHCQGHNGWRLACKMHVYAGGSDHMLYQRITVLNPGITASCSSVQPSFLAFIVVIVLFRGLMMVRMLFEKNISKSSLLATFQNWRHVSREKELAP